MTKSAFASDLPAAVWSPHIHIAELDGVRGLAILIVTINRFARYLPDQTWVGSMLHTVVAMGERGVDLFFVLSGFLITGVLLDSKIKKHFFRNFLARRTLRIFPLYFLSLFAFLILIPSLWPSSDLFREGRSNQFYLWTYLANVKISMAGEWCLGSLDHFWSLAVEEHFYLLWPVIVFALSRQQVQFFALILAAVCALSRISFAIVSDNGVAPDVMSFFRFDGLLLGAATACQARSIHGLRLFRLASMITVVCSFVTCLSLEVFTTRFLTISHSVWAIFWASLLVLLLTSQPRSLNASIFRSSILRSLGKYSYAMYVFQSPLIPIASGILSTSAIAALLGLDADQHLLPTMIYTVVMFMMTYFLGICSWNILEKHCLKLKRFF